MKNSKLLAYISMYFFNLEKSVWVHTKPSVHNNAIFYANCSDHHLQIQQTISKQLQPYNNTSNHK